MSWDFAIAGAGPSGAAAAAYLARAGYSVIVLERETFPRFRIGESLLPLGLEILKDLGLELDHAPYALRKAGAVVFSESDQQEYRISFDATLPGCLPYAYQVERAPFDLALADKASECGAQICFDTKVTSIREAEDRVIIQAGKQQISARYFLDASGQNVLVARLLGVRHRVSGLGRTATFTHFSGVDNARARKLFQHGDILLLLNQDTAWGWAIPLPGDRLGVGVVHGEGHKPGPPEECLANYLAGSSLMGKLLQNATRDRPIRRCSDYSYYATPSYTNRIATIGDAHAFLDPVFSSGISLGLFAAKKLAEYLPPMVNADQPLSLDSYYEHIAHGYRVFERILERFYRPGWAMTTFFSPEKPAEMVQQLNTILAGYVWREDNEWQNQLLRSKPRRLKVEGEQMPVF